MQAQTQTRFDVAIVGAGIAGGSLALALSGNGLSIALIEPQPMIGKTLPEGHGPGDYDSRVSALTPRSVALLQSLGAWDDIAGYRHCPYRHMRVWDAEGTGAIEFGAAELGVPALGHIVENRSIVSSLLGRIAQAPDIRCFNPDKLTSCERDESGGVNVCLESGEQLSAALLVGADGALSRVRDMFEFTTREWDYGHQALVCTVQVEKHHQACAWQRFLPTGPLAFLPLPGPQDIHCCSIVWSLQDSAAERILALDDSEFCAELGAAIEHRLGAVLDVSSRFAFPLRQRHAVDYVQPSVALVADAAHTIHPLAGQGINLGLQDVAALAQELIRASERGRPLGQLEVLARYQRRRKGENLLMMGAMDGFKRLFEQQALPVRWLRNAGMRGVAQLLPLKQRLMRHAMGID